MDKLPILNKIDEFDPNDSDIDIEEYDIEPIDYDIKGFEDEENILWTGHPHIISLLGQIIIGSILFVSSVIMIPLNYINNFEFLLNDIAISWYHITLIGIMTSILIFISSYVSIKFTRYVLTDQAIYLQSGLIRQRVKRLPADTIQTHEYNQTIPERLLNFGTIEVTTAGTDGIELTYRSISNPKRIHTLIGELIENRTYNSQIKNQDEYRSQLLSEINKLSEKIE